MNAIVARSLLLAAVIFAGVMQLGKNWMDEAEPYCFGPGTVNLVHELPNDWLAVRAEAKLRLADDLIARRRSLWEVAALFWRSTTTRRMLRSGTYRIVVRIP